MARLNTRSLATLEGHSVIVDLLCGSSLFLHSDRRSMIFFFASWGVEGRGWLTGKTCEGSHAAISLL